jgi:hypothetical protein
VEKGKIGEWWRHLPEVESSIGRTHKLLRGTGCSMTCSRREKAVGEGSRRWRCEWGRKQGRWRCLPRKRLRPTGWFEQVVRPFVGCTRVGSSGWNLTHGCGQTPRRQLMGRDAASEARMQLIWELLLLGRWTLSHCRCSSRRSEGAARLANGAARTWQRR